jgi:hypothetical protein
MDVHILSLRSWRQNRAWGGARQRGTPGILCKHTSSLRSGRQLFVIRYFIIVEIGPMAVARFAGWCDKSLSYLGFRTAALHPRLYAAARIRGLRTRQNVGNDNMGSYKNCG